MFQASSIWGRVIWLIWPVGSKQQGLCVFWAGTFKTYWVTFSLNLSSHQWQSQSHMWKWQYDKMKDSWVIGSTDALEDCLISGATLLCKVLTFWISYHSQSCKCVHGTSTLCHLATFCHLLWNPGLLHSTLVGHTRSCLGVSEDIVPLVP